MMKAKMTVVFVQKRDGSVHPFKKEKIVASIEHAGRDTGEYKKSKAQEIAKKVLAQIQEIGKTRNTIKVQEIRDIVEPTIAQSGFFATAKYYILFGEKKQQKAKKHQAIVEPTISDTAKEVAGKRYVRTDMDGKPIESVGEMFWRVARHIAKAEIEWGQNGIVDETAKKFYDRMVNMKFVCAGKAMFEAGNPGGTGQLSSCFVLPIRDSIQDIFKTLGDAAVVHKNNGGTGFNFSKIRPHGDKVKNVPKAASGPVDFIRAFSAALSQILQGAKRQGANIAILNADHPDIIEFVTMKDEDGTIKNFNVSVGVTNAFMEAVQANRDWDLINPRNGEVWKTIKARELFDMIAEHAWATGDPGLAFLDRMEQDNPTPSLGKLDATNPCITGDALVKTNEGFIRLDEAVQKVHRGESLSVYTHSNVFQKVTAGYIRGKKKIFEIQANENTIFTTADHRFLSKGSFTELSSLVVGDTITVFDERTQKQQDVVISSIQEGGEKEVFDLAVEHDHSFIANGFVVHNCGEIALLPYESCNLTSIVLNNHLKKTKNDTWEIDWDDLEKSVKLGVRFLDDMIEVNAYALESIRQMVKEGNRRIGLGVMGFAHMLYKMNIPYDSDEAVRISERVAKFIRKKAEETSIELAKERGAFPNFDVSIYAGSAERYRNCALMMIAPTGTTSLLADTSSGIEPVFSLVQVRRSFNEDNRKNAPTREFTIVDPIFELFLDKKFDAKTKEKILKQIVADGGIENVKQLTKEEKRIFTTTHEIKPDWHIKIQAAWQKWIDNSVSKTINFSHSATVEDVKKAYMTGWKMGLKGITIYRDGSKMDQVLNVKGKEGKTSKDAAVPSLESMSSSAHASAKTTKMVRGGKQICPECGSASVKNESGCISCPDCGWSKCTL